jgi:hypothetical protein
MATVKLETILKKISGRNKANLPRTGRTRDAVEVVHAGGRKGLTIPRLPPIRCDPPQPGKDYAVIPTDHGLEHAKAQAIIVASPKPKETSRNGSNRYFIRLEKNLVQCNLHAGILWSLVALDKRVWDVHRSKMTHALLTIIRSENARM